MATARERWNGLQRRFRGKAATNDIASSIDERHDLEARAGMLRETSEVSNYSMVTHLVVAVVLGYIFWGHASSIYLVGLNISMLVVVSATMGWTYWWRNHFGTTASEAVVRRGINGAKLAALLIGLLWSTMPALLIPSQESGYQMVAVATSAGLISDAYVVGPILAVSTLLIVPMVLGTFVGVFGCAYPFNVYLSLLLVIYALFTLFSTRRMSELSYQRLLDRVVVRDQSQTIGLLLNEFEESATDWLWEMDAVGRLRHAPPRMAAAIGEQADRLGGATLSSLLSRYACRRDEPNGIAEIFTAVARRQPFHDHVVRLETSQGTRWWCLNGKPSWEPGGAFTGYQGVGSDITRSREAETRIAYLASHDTLTGLPNRGAFQSAIDRVCRDAGSCGAQTALLYVDLDGFKAVNDGAGHTVGDLLLRTVGSRLAALCDARIQVYRLGGDEFAILQTCDDPASAEALASQVVAHVGRTYTIDGLNLGVGASVGIARTSADMHDAATLLSRADLALYNAKASGKGRWKNFDPQLEQQTLRRRRLDAKMRAALAAEEFQLHYQPLVDVKSEKVIGVEALLRWYLPEEGWISPVEIIPIAEATGFIVDIGRWVLRRACTDVLAWPGLTVAVNISSAHFRSATFCDEVEAVLDLTGLAPARLEIEITESIFLEGEGEATANMLRLRTTGVRLSLDDFGTGYSSLNYLSKFVFDKLKIDRSFVRDLHVRRDMLAIFDAINALAVALRMSVTVEGVEHQEQIEVLRPRFDGSIQGYYYSRPRPADQIADQILMGQARLGMRQNMSLAYSDATDPRAFSLERRAS